MVYQRQTALFRGFGILIISAACLVISLLWPPLHLTEANTTYFSGADCMAEKASASSLFFL
jgi:hypothetical protein